MITKQEAFNLVWERAKDKRRAVAHGRCLYRAPDGLKCFVGVLIPDEKYDARFDSEWRTTGEVMDCDKELERFLCSLQGIHDWTEPAEWERLLRQVALAEGLEVPR